MNKNYFGISIIHWLAALLLMLVMFAWSGYQQGLFGPAEISVTRVAFDADCDLRAGPCLTTLEDGSTVSFGIQPRSIPVAETLDIEVKVSGRDVESVTIDLNGVDMKMPPNRVKLKSSGKSEFNGQAGLMFCTLSAMEWETVVELTTPNGQVNVPYRFITVNNAGF